MKLTTIYLIRHAQSEGNAHFDKGLGRLPFTELGSDLTEFGVAQAKELVADLKEVSFSAIYSSHLRRAFHTAEILAVSKGMPVVQMKELREREEGREADEEATTRFMEALDSLVSNHPGETIAVVTHGFVIRVFLGSSGVRSLDDMESGYVQNAGYIKLIVSERKFTLIDCKRVG